MKVFASILIVLVCSIEGLKFPNIQRFLEENNPLVKKFAADAENKGRDYFEKIFRLVGRQRNNDNDALASVQNMKIEHDSFNKLAPFLLRGAPLLSYNIKNVPSHQRPIKLEAYHWESCGPANQTVNLRKLTIKPDPVILPGDFQLSFDVEFRKTLNGKLNGKVLMEVQTRGGTWIHFPCVGNIGSCSYKDLCEVSQMIPACPAEFIAANIPCKCPFNKGDYSLQGLTVEIDAPVFLPGTYRATLTLSGPSGDQLGCYKVTVSFA